MTYPGTAHRDGSPYLSSERALISNRHMMTDNRLESPNLRLTTHFTGLV